jgi:branched-chain amino acid transport system permease protein
MRATRNGTRSAGRRTVLQLLKTKPSRKVAIRVGGVAVVVAVVLLLGAQKDFGVLQYGQLVMAGLGSGAVYALVALGFVMVFTVTGIINFSQGAFVMLGALFTVTLYASPFTGEGRLGLALAAVLAVFITAGVGLAVERLTISPARRAGADHLTLIIITVGVYITIQGMALIYWGHSGRSLPAFTTMENSDLIFRPWGIVIKAQTLWVMATTFIVFAALSVFLGKTMIGKALRACSVNPSAARLMGINPGRMSAVAFAIAAGIGSIAGIMLAPLTRPVYDMGLTLGLKGFVAAAMGGLISLPAALFGGFFLGMVENVAAGVTKSGLKDMFTFIVLIGVLLRRRGFRGGAGRFE